MRKFILFLFFVFVAALIFIKFYAPSFVKSKISEFNNQSDDINITADKIKFSYPFSFNFENLKIFDKNRPFINAYIDSLQSYVSLKDILELAFGTRNEGNLYDGSLDLNVWKNIRGEDIRADLTLDKVLLTKHSLLQGFPLKGGYVDFKGFNNVFDKNMNLKYLGGDFAISDLEITDEFTLPATLTGMIYDLQIPKIKFSKISSNYRYKENVVTINNFKISSDVLNLASDTCEYNTKNSKLSNCIIKFNITEDGFKSLATYISLLNQFFFTPNGNTLQSTGTYTIRLDGRINNPNVSF